MWRSVNEHLEGILNRMSEGKGPGGEDRPGYSWEPTERGMGFWTQDDSEDDEAEDQRYALFNAQNKPEFGGQFGRPMSKEDLIKRMKGMGFDFMKWNHSPKGSPALHGQPRFKGIDGPTEGPNRVIRYRMK